MTARGSRNAWTQGGFTIVEVLIAATILLVGVLGTVSLIDSANATTRLDKAREGGTNLSRELVEAARDIPYQSLTPTSLVPAIQSEPGLSDSSPNSGWTISRRGFSYDVTAAVCTLDDPADGTGGHAGATFCADVPAAGSDDRNPDDYKRVVIEVRWGPGTRFARQSAVIVNPGTGIGPDVTSLTMTTPQTDNPAAPPPITNESVTAASFAVTTSGDAAAVSWSIDGAPQGTAQGSSTSFSFTWQLGAANDAGRVDDGTYVIGARAVDRRGNTGSQRLLTLTLNRFLPRAPRGFLAGRSGAAIEAEWLPNTERDVIGYQVYRVVAGGTDALVCPLTPDNSCRIENAPSATDYYYVRAYDRGPDGQPRAGDRSTQAQVAANNQPPNAVTGLSAATQNGATILSWQAANPADPDGDQIAFYRIYRDGSAYEDRYDRTLSGDVLSYVDTETGGVQHTYWVSAVDTQLAESPLTGPVTR